MDRNYRTLITKFFLFINLFTNYSFVYCQDSLQIKNKIEYKTSEKNLINKIQNIWESNKATINSEILDFNLTKKNYVTVKVYLSEDVFNKKTNQKIHKTKTTLFNELLNLHLFKGINLNFSLKNSSTFTDKSITIYEVVDKIPVIKGCSKELNQKKQEKCFEAKVKKLIKRQFDTKKMQKLGLEKKEHIVLTSFTINKNGKISNLTSKHENEIVRKEAKKVFNKIEIKSPAINNGNFTNITYTIPITFTVE